MKCSLAQPFMTSLWKYRTTNLHIRLFFLTHSLIGSINARILILTNRQVVLIGLTYIHITIICTFQSKYCSIFLSSVYCGSCSLLLQFCPSLRVAAASNGCVWYNRDIIILYRRMGDRKLSYATPLRKDLIYVGLSWTTWQWGPVWGSCKTYWIVWKIWNILLFSITV